MSKSAPTSADVARLAGVSRPTVNRVLGGYGYASPDTIDKVKAAATSLGYRQNAAARTLLTGRSGTVGVIVVDIENPYFSTIVAEVCRAAQAAGYQTLIMSSEGDSTVEAQAVEAMLAQRVDGLIIAPNSASATDHLDAVTAVGVPVVAIDRIPVASQLNTVSIDNVQAGYDATCLLIEEGRKRIGIVTYDPRPHAAIWAALDTPNPHELNPSPQRLLGYLQALRSAGLRADPDLIAFAPKQSNKAGLEATDRLLSYGVDAIFATDNVLSVGSYFSFSAHEITVPDQLSFVAFDDVEWTKLTNPPLTVVAHSITSMGTRAAGILLQRLQSPSASAEPSHLVLEHKIIRRGTTRPL